MSSKNTFALILLVSMFFFWGLAANMTDTLLAAFKKIMSMTDFQTSMIQQAFYGAYFFLAFPAALYIKKFTFKSGVLLGLGLFITGAVLFYPASISMQYTHFLLALFLLAGGLAILETSANPYILILGSKETATRRLNLAQSFNPIGALSGVFLSKIFILSNLNHADATERSEMTSEMLQKIQSEELSAVMSPYVGVALILVLIWILIFFTKMPKTTDVDHTFRFSEALKRILKKRNYVFGVLAQLFYVGAQIGVWSFTIRYVMQELEINEEKASTYYIISLIVFSASRFISTWLMKYFSPQKLLISSSLLAIIVTLLAGLSNGMVGVVFMISISAFMSLMFPTIFSFAVTDLGNDTKIAGSGLVMAIVGGAIFTAFQGLVSDHFNSIKISLIVPMICFAVVLFYAFYSFKN